MNPDWIVGQPSKALGVILLGHGAGAPMDSAYMERLSTALVAEQIAVVRFEFPYMASRRETGVKRPPPKAEKLLPFLASQVERVADCFPSLPIYLGGKSMSARIATLAVVHNEKVRLSVRGVAGFGFPFHAPGKLAGMRVDHLAKLNTPVVICQGTRDPFGKPEEVAGYSLAPSVRLHWLDSGDHDFKPLKASGRHQHELIAEAASFAAKMLLQVNKK